MNKKKRQPIYKALSKSADSISKFLSPMVVFVGLITDFKKVVKFVAEHYVISLTFLVFMLLIFGHHLFDILSKREQNTEKPELKDGSNWNQKRIISLVGTAILIISIGFATYLFALTINGLHYPIISSIPNNNNTDIFINNINEDLERNGHSDFSVSYYCRSGQKYCALVANGVNFSIEEAKESIQRANELIPEYVDSTHRITSYSVKGAITKKWESAYQKIFGRQDEGKEK